VKRNPSQRRAAHRQRDVQKALAEFLGKLPVDVLEEQEIVTKVMSDREGRRLNYQMLLEVRDEVRRIVGERQAYEDEEDK
jgi:hypothetical protein